MIRSAETGPISQPALLRCRERTPMVPTHSAGRKTLPTAGKTSQAPAARERLSLPPLYVQGQRKAPRRELPSPSATASRWPDPAAHGFMLCLAPARPLAPENALLKVLRILSKKNPSPGPGMQGALCQGCPPPHPPRHWRPRAKALLEQRRRASAPGPASSGMCPAHRTVKPHNRVTGRYKTAKPHQIIPSKTRDAPH